MNNINYGMLKLLQYNRNMYFFNGFKKIFFKITNRYDVGIYITLSLGMKTSKVQSATTGKSNSIYN